ncbi:hypothetical protein [Nostoc sp. NOS(2021)]|nr:hypothetical protein [Nostoc sp. NOS(2021)]
MSTTGYAYALQKTSKIKRSLVCKSERCLRRATPTPCRKPQK